MDATGAPYDLIAAGDPRTYADLATPEGLAWIAKYADGIGPNKNLVIPRDANGFLLAPTTLVADAHAEDLLVHLFTFRDENQFLPADFRVGTDPNAKGDAFAEYDIFFDQGIDGLFSDFTDTAIAARDWHFGTTTAAPTGGLTHLAQAEGRARARPSATAEAQRSRSATSSAGAHSAARSGPSRPTSSPKADRREPRVHRCPSVHSPAVSRVLAWRSRSCDFLDTSRALCNGSICPAGVRSLACSR